MTPGVTRTASTEGKIPADFDGDVNQNHLIQIIVSEENEIRNRSLEKAVETLSAETLLADASVLDRFWRKSGNLYHQVRALFFLSAIHRFHLPPKLDLQAVGQISFNSYQQLLGRRYIEAIDSMLAVQRATGPSDALCSGLSHAYRDLAFQTLADQVRRSVRTVRGNQWMFRTGHPDDHPLRLRRELCERKENSPQFPILTETTAVRMDFSHSGWSDIFFLGMDFPSGARVINASINLSVLDRDGSPKPPIECSLRVIDQPVLRLVSVDLKTSTEIKTIAEVFDFARDYLGLLKAAVIAAGIVPPGMEGCGQSMEHLLGRLIGPGLGLEIVSNVNNIPKGSRLAVSTNLLGSLISLCMRATGQVTSLAGELQESDRRIIAARAILGEWIGGSGGGWQDSGGIWPGIKLIQGSAATAEDPEFGMSRGRLLPQHRVYSESEISPLTRQRLQESLVLVHGGMAQNVGPILEMVTEKYLLRSPDEWQARLEAMEILEEISAALQRGDIRAVGAATHRNFFGPLQKIIPWCTNLFTNLLVQQCQQKYGDKFWGFWMLGGMAGGGMGFIFDSEIKPAAQRWLKGVLADTKKSVETRLPFAMEPVIYDFEINDQGSWGVLHAASSARMSDDYYALMVPRWLKRQPREWTGLERFELEQLGSDYRGASNPRNFRKLFEGILPGGDKNESQSESLEQILERVGFDADLHEQVQSDLASGRYGLAQNRLPINTSIENVKPTDFYDARTELCERHQALGTTALRDGTVAVVTLSAGVGSRWTEGAGVVKGLHPFCQFNGRHRSFLEVHLAKSQKVGSECGTRLPHIVTTGYLTHQPIAEHLAQQKNFGYQGPLLLSPGRFVGLRTIPMLRDLQFAWEEMPQQLLDEQQEKMRASVRTALMGWARQMGEGSDYRDNTPLQCLHPVGHWYEIPNLLRNGVLSDLLTSRPHLKTLMLHNVDTLGASVEAGMLGRHLDSGNGLTFEVIARRLEDRGGGLARVNGLPRLVEGLALPREEDEFKLSFYNSMTTWIDIDQLLNVFGLTREQLSNATAVDQAVRTLSQRMPTYITIKDVKKRWGHGHEDVYPVCQFEKLWSDMSGLSETNTGFAAVPLQRGQQLKEQGQLDAWLRDGTAAYVESLCEWSS